MRPSTASFLSACLIAALLVSGQAFAATKSDVLDAAVKAADRLPTIRVPRRTWEDAPYLVGILLVARHLDERTPGSGQPWIDRASTVIDGGDSTITHGDYAGYSQAAMDLYRIASPIDASRRAALLDATEGPIEFAARALRVGPSSGPTISSWWVEGGFGTRFWVDDLFTLPPWLAMRGSRREGLPADPFARDLAYEWIESYLYDHRPPAADPVAAAVPSQRERAGPFLWNPGLSLFRHDPGLGAERYWGRGNGWAAWGLARSARYLDSSYGGSRYAEVVDRTGIREVLSRLASALAARRSDDGGWPTDLVHPEACPASETSATGLITYMLATGVNEGWLDRTAFTPVVLKAFSLLLGRLDARGDLAGIQPPGTGPECRVTASNDPSVDVSYGVGAFLLAVSEVLKFPDADLEALEDAALCPVDRAFVAPTRLVASVDACDGSEILLTDDGASSIRRRPEKVGRGVVDDAACVPRRVAVPLWTALAGGESTTFIRSFDGFVALGGKNTSPRSASMVVEVRPADGTFGERFTLALDPGGAAFETRFVPAGSEVILSNASDGGGIVPLKLDLARSR